MGVPRKSEEKERRADEGQRLRTILALISGVPVKGNQKESLASWSELRMSRKDKVDLMIRMLEDRVKRGEN